MKPFRYWRDPLFLLACALYATNRWLVRPHVHSAFLRFWFDDLLLIPAALPLLLQLHAWLKLRPATARPSGGEIAAHVIGWSVLFEVIAPHLMRHVTGDPWDVVAYAVGGGLAYLWWHRDRWSRYFRVSHEL